MQGRNNPYSQSDSPLPPMQPKKDRGQVVSLKTSFGFIRCLNSPEQVFFHLNDIRATPRFTGESALIRVGDEVEFEVEQKTALDSARRLSARYVQKIPKGSVVFEELLEAEGRKSALVVSELNYNRTEREPVGGEVRVEEGGELLKFTGRDVMYYPIKLLEGDKVEISVFCDKKTKRRGATRIRLVEPCLARRERGLVCSTHKNSYGFIRCTERNEQKLFFHFSERLDNDYVPKEGEGVEFNVINDINGKICASRLLQVDADKVLFVKVLPTVFRGKVVNGLKYTRATKDNGVKQIGGQINFNTLVAGKPVAELLSFDSCDIASEDTTFMPGDKVEFRIAIFRPTGKRHAHEVKLIDKAPQNYERGLVGFVRKGEFGFIERPNADNDIYFKITDENAEIFRNSSVEYVVIEPAMGPVYAESVKLLPPGTVEFFDVSKEAFEGTVSELANAAAAALKASDDAKRNAVAGVIEYGQNGRKIDFKNKNLRNPKIPLKIGDTVSFHTQKDLRFNGGESAIGVTLLRPCPSEKREIGVVTCVKSDFGFLASIENANVFFHFSEIAGGSAVRVQENDEYSYETRDENGKKFAKRLLPLPKNTVFLDDVDAHVFIGKVQTNGLDYKPGGGYNAAGTGYLDYCNNELYNDMILRLTPETVINERNNKEIAKAIFSLPFRPSDVAAGSRSLVAGDFARFRVAAARANGRLRATQIELLPKLGRVGAAPNAGAAGELQDIVSKEFFDFEEGPVKAEKGTTVIFDVLAQPHAHPAEKRSAFNLRVRDYLVLEKGFFEGFIREIEIAEKPPGAGEDISAQFSDPKEEREVAAEEVAAEEEDEVAEENEVETDLLTGDTASAAGMAVESAAAETPGGNLGDPFDFWDFG